MTIFIPANDLKYNFILQNSALPQTCTKLLSTVLSTKDLRWCLRLEETQLYLIKNIIMYVSLSNNINGIIHVYLSRNKYLIILKRYKITFEINILELHCKKMVSTACQYLLL